MSDPNPNTPSPKHPDPTPGDASGGDPAAPPARDVELPQDIQAQLEGVMERVAGARDGGPTADPNADPQRAPADPEHPVRPNAPAETGPDKLSEGSGGVGPTPDDPPANQPVDPPETPEQPGPAGHRPDAGRHEAQHHAGARRDAGPRNIHDTRPIGGAAKPALRGPRVVEAGREHRTGLVVSIGPSDIFIEFGPKELGVLERTQFKEGDELPKVGEPYEVIVQRYDANESIYICARPGVVQKADWELLSAGQVVEAVCTGVNKGGLDMEVAQHRAFLPASQISTERVEDLNQFIGQKLACEVQRVERTGKGNIVLSRRNLLAKEREEAATKLRETLKEGDTVEGTVKRLADFGAFVDVGGIDGLVHISDLSHDRVGHGIKAVERHVKVGQKVNVQILQLDWDKGRISLGLKQLQADPFREAASDITEGSEVNGRVKRITEFGAFIEIAPGVEGLCHISELEWRRVRHPSEVVKEDEVVQAKVLKLDPDSRKISLSLKALKESPRNQQDRKAEEIRGEDSRQMRRLREEHQKKAKQKSTGKGGLGDFGGMGLGDLKL